LELENSDLPATEDCSTVSVLLQIGRI
jgi:hypothetical protein